jgi:hypothetical protein
MLAWGNGYPRVKFYCPRKKRKRALQYKETESQVSIPKIFGLLRVGMGFGGRRRACISPHCMKETQSPCGERQQHRQPALREL